MNEQISPQELQEMIQQVAEAETENFAELAQLAGLDLKRDFAEADLSRTDLSGADLSSADLSSADLSSADLSKSNLVQANFKGADLRYANINKAKVFSADFNNTKIIFLNAWLIFLNAGNMSSIILSRIIASSFLVLIVTISILVTIIKFSILQAFLLTFFVIFFLFVFLQVRRKKIRQDFLTINQADNYKPITNIVRMIKKVSETTSVLIFIGIIFAIAIFSTFFYEFNLIENSIRFKPNIISDLSGIINTLLIVSLAIQSVIEIVVSNIQAPKKEEKKEEKNLIQSKTTDDLSNLSIEEINKLNKDIKKISLQTRKISYSISLLLGLLISISGIRIIQPLTSELELSKFQISLFHFLDIFLTGALISGGTEGIHSVTKVYKKFINPQEKE